MEKVAVKQEIENQVELSHEETGPVVYDAATLDDLEDAGQHDALSESIRTYFQYGVSFHSSDAVVGEPQTQNASGPDLPSTSPNHVPVQPPVDLSDFGDENFSNMLYAWYYAGYYTGLYRASKEK